jgi:transcriptional regulator with XRE-family HTH domain
VPVRKSLTARPLTLYAYDYMGHNPFAQKIKKQRQDLGLSLRKVCEDVLNEDGKKISVSYLNDIEQGHRNPPSGKIIIQLAKVLNLDAPELLSLAGKADPVIEDAITEDAEVGVLFRRIIQKAKTNPGILDQLNKKMDENK